MRAPLLLRARIGVLCALLLGCGGTEEPAAPSPAAVAEPAGATGVEAPSAAPLAEPGPAECNHDYQCVVIADACGALVGAPRTRAAEVERTNLALAAHADCAPGAPRPVVPTCTPAGRCDLAPLDHPEWRTCSRDDECVSVAIACRFAPVRRDALSDFLALHGGGGCGAERLEGLGACRAGVCLVPAMLPALEGTTP